MHTHPSHTQTHLSPVFPWWPSPSPSPLYRGYVATVKGRGTGSMSCCTQPQPRVYATRVRRKMGGVWAQPGTAAGNQAVPAVFRLNCITVDCSVWKTNPHCPKGLQGCLSTRAVVHIEFISIVIHDSTIASFPGRFGREKRPGNFHEFKLHTDVTPRQLHTSFKQ